MKKHQEKEVIKDEKLKAAAEAKKNIVLQKLEQKENEASLKRHAAEEEREKKTPGKN